MSIKGNQCRRERFPAQTLHRGNPPQADLPKCSTGRIGLTLDRTRVRRYGAGREASISGSCESQGRVIFHKNSTHSALQSQGENQLPRSSLLLSHLKHLVAEISGSTFSIRIRNCQRRAARWRQASVSIPWMCSDSASASKRSRHCICGGRVPQRVFTSHRSLADFINTGARHVRLVCWGSEDRVNGADSAPRQPFFPRRGTGVCQPGQG